MSPDVYPPYPAPSPAEPDPPAGLVAPAAPARFAHPASLNAPVEPGPGLSRWLWLVKWFLIIPHAFILFFLWIAFVLLTVVAFFAILFTGRYPRGIFTFNLGVMRWSWRVRYYGYGALGTDRYPPFTLADVPDYPARFDLAYPERLSRGKVLVKWWLLAIPQYVVLAILLNGGALGWGDDHHFSDATSGLPGLLQILIAVVAVSLLFRGRYPKPLYDLILGVDRWVARVAVYAALMTDVYPPFRLDQGGPDPSTAAPLPPAPQAPFAPTPASFDNP